MNDPKHKAQFLRQRPWVEAAFDSRVQKISGLRALEQFIAAERSTWRLSRVPKEKIVELLQTDSQLSRIDLASENYRDETRFVWRTASPFEIALSIRPGSYLSHATAAFLHRLSDGPSSHVYVNKEQSPKDRAGGLNQVSLDRAFKNQQRQSNLTYSDTLGNVYVVLAGRYTNGLEVGTVKGMAGETLTATKLERTLIDLAVRPLYAGGVEGAANAFARAKGTMDPSVLIRTLKKLNYVYPYHQAIGFYLERAGFDGAVLDRFREMGLQYDFYLAHGMKNMAFDTSWRVHYPTKSQGPESFPCVPISVRHRPSFN